MVIGGGLLGMESAMSQPEDDEDLEEDEEEELGFGSSPDASKE